jgi:hypothetical protein
MSDKIEITKADLREMLGYAIGNLQKDVSDSWHDIRVYEYVDSDDIDSITDEVFDNLKPQ